MNFRLALILIGLATLARFIPHPPNFTPLAAIALFGGARIGSRLWAVAIPLGALLISDSILGLYPDWLFVYGAFAAIAVLGYVLAPTSRAGVFALSLTASLWFFVVTNFGVWLMADFYPHTWAGLSTCFTAALPFLRNTVISTTLFTVALFSAYGWLERSTKASRGFPARQSLPM